MSIPTEAIEAQQAWFDYRKDYGSWPEPELRQVHKHFMAGYEAALTAAAPVIAKYARVEAIADAACYLERIHPAGLTPRNMVLADLAVVESRMMRGLRANGNNRADQLEGKGS